jgi:prepilin-type N-terminal cleavage/methylation domain-containing protein
MRMARMLFAQGEEGAIDMRGSRLRRLHGARMLRGRRAGFTLIELLSVVAIIGVLVAIALPRLLGFRQSAFDARAKADLRNAATSEEAYFLGEGDYLTCTDDVCKNQLPNFRLSPGVSISMNANNGPQPTFVGTSYTAGGVKTFTYDSSAGGLKITQ